MMIDYSDDLRVFKNQRFLSMGKSGEFDTLLQLNRLGASINRIFRMTITDPVKVRIAGADARITMSQRTTDKARRT